MPRSGTRQNAPSDGAGVVVADEPPTGVAVSIDHVNLWFGAFHALTNISFDVQRGQFLSIVGPTGCGKSSLLNLIAGLLEPTAGEVLTHGEPVRGVNPRCGYMFQSEALLPWRTALDNVMLGPILHGMPRHQARIEATEWLAKVGLRGFEDRYPHHLSGGQRKRVAMAQVLINRPEILLMDEPFGALDAQTRALMGQELSNLWFELQSTVVFVTHDLEEAIALSDRIILITSGPDAAVKGDYDVEVARPRQVTDARFMTGFDDVYQRVWANLREEVMVTYERNIPA